jgi:hypothetical protein
MGAKYLGSYVGMARPILVERDYQAVKRLLADRCKGIYLLLEAERIEALIRSSRCTRIARTTRLRSSPSRRQQWTHPRARSTDAGPIHTESHPPGRSDYAFTFCCNR